jgi:hypothetical protein
MPHADSPFMLVRSWQASPSETLSSAFYGGHFSKRN